MSGLPERLARTVVTGRRHASMCGCDHEQSDPDCPVGYAILAATSAIRVALDEAVKVAREHERLCSAQVDHNEAQPVELFTDAATKADIIAVWAHMAQECGEIATDIEELKTEEPPIA